jgi:hypothetical protein
MNDIALPVKRHLGGALATVPAWKGSVGRRGRFPYSIGAERDSRYRCAPRQERTAHRARDNRLSCDGAAVVVFTTSVDL